MELTPCKTSVTEAAASQHEESAAEINFKVEKCLNKRDTPSLQVFDSEPLQPKQDESTIIVEEKPYVPDAPSFKSTLQSSEHFCNEYVDIEMQLSLKNNVDTQEALEELLHKKIEIKVEDEGEWEKDDNIYFANVYETASNSPRSATQSSDNGNKLDRSVSDKTTYFKTLKLHQHVMTHSRKKLFACD